MPRYRLVTRLVVATLALSAAVVPAFAQDRLLIRQVPGPGTPPVPAQEFGAIARFGQPLGARPFWVSNDQVGGGRFMVHMRGNLPGIGPDVPAVIIETFTGRPVAVHGVVVAVDPIRPRVFTWAGDTLSVEDVLAGTSTPLQTAIPFLEAAEARYAPNADLLFVSRASGLSALDGTSGAVRRTLPALGVVGTAPLLTSPDMGSTWFSSPDGARLFVLAADSSAVRVLDGATGTELTRSPLAGGSNGVLMPDWTGERLFVAQGNPNAWRLTALTTSGQALGNAPLAGYCPPTVRTSPHTRRVYMSSFAGGGGSYYGPITQALSVFDGPSLGALGHVTIANDIDLCGGIQLVLVTPPGAPAQATATVAGHDVTLAWTNAGNAIDFVLDVGLVPGQTALTLPLGATTSATITNVPSGRYYARVRGGNAFGSSPPSTEITIVVP